MSGDSNGELIRLEGVCKSFLTEEIETHALQQIDLTITRGEYISISGPSGCGKSTLLSILGLLDTANDGEYSSSISSMHFGGRHSTRSAPWKSASRWCARYVATHSSVLI